ncbi:MAG: prolipoprotein diacylglyceryl transferase [Myxococcota bacterium]|jgi:phosphatidylglycerol:prolipoprotein diacylglycerol transferase
MAPNINLGLFSLPAYYSMLVVGFSVCIFMGWLECRRTGLDPRAWLDMCIVLVITAMLGARFMHVLAENMPHDFYYSASLHKGAATIAELTSKGANDIELVALRGEPIRKFYFHFPAQIFYLWKGGLAFYGGLLLATASCMGFMVLRKMPVVKTTDVVMSIIPLGLVFGRLGCFLNGCCFGLRSVCCGVEFPKASAAYAEMRNSGVVGHSDLHTPPVLPSMLYEAAACLAIFIWLFFIVRPRKRFDGQISTLFGIAYSVARFIIEYSRNDNRGSFFAGTFSASQVVSLCVFTFSVVMYYMLSKKNTHASRTV